MDYAIIPSRRSGPNIVKNTAMGIVAGAVLCAAMIVLRYMLDGKSKEMIKTPDDLHAMYPGIMVLAMIPDMRVPEKKNGYYSSYYGPADTKKKGGKADGRSKGA